MNKARPRQEKIFATHVIDKALESILSKVSYKLVRKKKKDNSIGKWTIGLKGGWVIQK